jgi:hypothetical protein
MGEVSGRLLVLSIGSVELQELNGRGLSEFDAQMAGDLAQGQVEVWKVVDRHVANEGSTYFVVTRAPMQPAQEEVELHAGGEADDDPVGVHVRHRLLAGNYKLHVGNQNPEAEACATEKR